jgi:hypothetical protein
MNPETVANWAGAYIMWLLALASTAIFLHVLIKNVREARAKKREWREVQYLDYIKSAHTLLRGTSMSSQYDSWEARRKGWLIEVEELLNY